MLQLVHNMLIGGAQKPPKKVYATQQEEMDAELEAAMAADAAAADTDTQDSTLAAVGYGASPGGSPKGRTGPRLELPGSGGGIDFDALDLAATRDVSAGGDPQQASRFLPLLALPCLALPCLASSCLASSCLASSCAGMRSWCKGLCIVCNISDTALTFACMSA